MTAVCRAYSRFAARPFGFVRRAATRRHRAVHHPTEVLRAERSAARQRHDECDEQREDSGAGTAHRPITS